MFDLPLPLDEFLAGGGDLRSVLGTRYQHLLDDLVESLSCTADERERRAASAFQSAEMCARGQSTMPGVQMSESTLRELCALWRWEHDLMSDAVARQALFNVLDPIEIAEVEVAADQLLRPAPLIGHVSTGERCESCGTVIIAGERMLTFEVRYEPRATEVVGAELFGRELYEQMADGRTEEQITSTAWKWCRGCVSTAMAGTQA